MKLLIVPGLWEFSLPRLQREFAERLPSRPEIAIAGAGQSAEQLLEIHRPDHVIGHSFGCPRAAAMADHVQSLVLCCGFSEPNPIAAEVLRGWALASPELQPQLMKPWLFTQEGVSQHTPPRVPQKTIEHFLAGTEKPKPSKQTNVLIVAAQFDLLSTPQDTAKLGDLFPHSRLEILNSAHGAPLEHPEFLQDVLIGFYRRQSVRLGVRQNL